MKGSEVFVGGLPPTVTESTIRQLFSQCGEVLEIRLIKDHKGNVKGFCFVRFATKEAAEKAVKEKSGLVVDGKKIGVLPSTEQDTLYLGNLNKGWSADEFEGIVRQVFPDVVSVELATLSREMQSGNQRNRGFAFVKFSSHAAAARALRVGSKTEFILGNLHPAVQWAEEQPEVDPAVLSKIKIAFIRNLPTSADENFLMKLFEPFGEIEKVVLWRKGNSPVGFVHFTKRSDLENAIKGMHEKMVQWPKGGPTHKLSVEVARPTDKSKKRTREDSQGDIANKIPNNLKSRPGVKSENFLSSGSTASTQKQDIGYEDPYETAVMSLPITVKERLLRILRLNIATRFDIDIQNITNLKKLPESTAISVLDQFMLSGAEVKNKGVYLAGLISKHKVEQLRVDRSPHGLSHVGDIPTRGVAVSSLYDRVQYSIDDSFCPPVGSSMTSFTGRAQLPIVDSLSLDTHFPVPRLDKYASRYPTVGSDYPILSRASLGRTKESSFSPLQLTSSSYVPYERLKLSPRIADVSDVRPTFATLKHDDVTDSPLSRLPVRFGDMADSSPTVPQVRVNGTSRLSSHLPARLEDAVGHPPIRPQVRFDDVANLPPTQPRQRQLSKIYRDHYWVLMEELKLKYRAYYWEYGKSPFQEDDENNTCSNNNNSSANVKAENGEANFQENAEINRNSANGRANRCGVHGCKSKAMALTKFCQMHILSDGKQKLYKPCNYAIKSSQTGPILCGKPILRSTVPSYCALHFQKAEKHAARALKKAGLPFSSTSKLAPKINVVFAEFVHQIQSKRRAARKAALEITDTKDDISC